MLNLTLETKDMCYKDIHIQYLKHGPILKHACAMVTWPPVQISLGICFLECQAHVDKNTWKSVIDDKGINYTMTYWPSEKVRWKNIYHNV